MREILFRGKRIEDGKWIYGYYLDGKTSMADFPCITPFSGDAYDDDNDWEVDIETVGQYTGMTDKNGKKIFEHDIVRIAVCGTYDNYVISYDKENARFVVGDTGFTFWSYISTKIEVIGNIHDNRELLEGKA